MAPWLERILELLVVVLASSGFWAIVTSIREKKDAKRQMLLGLGHDRIIYLCMKYIDRGWITSDEYEDLNKYLYEPYTKMKGNGTAERLMIAVRKLPIKKMTHFQQIQQNRINKSQQNVPNGDSNPNIPSWF